MILSYLVGVTQGIVSSLIFTWISRAYSERNKEKVQSRDEKFFKNSKIEFYAGFFVTLFLTALPNSEYKIVNDSVRALTFLSLGFTLMGFLCVVEFVDTSVDKGKNDGSGDDSEKLNEKVK